MDQFTVITVLDGDTFDVTPNWQWNGSTGNRVRPAGYDAPELHEPGGQASKQKLERLILRKVVSLGAAHKIGRGRLVCEVYLNGKNLKDYFREYQ